MSDLLPPHSLSHEGLGERTLEVLRDLVVDGHFTPGERLNEVEIANSLGVSRGPVREALQRLASQGLLKLVPRRGSFVPEFTLAELTHLYEVRLALESMAARLAAGRRSDTDVAGLRALLERTGEILASDERVPYPVDLDFHRGILELAGNPRLLAHTEQVHLQLRLARSRSGYQPGRAKQAYREHLAIIEAIAGGDPQQAEEAMRSHLGRSLASVQSLFGPATESLPVDSARLDRLSSEKRA